MDRALVILTLIGTATPVASKRISPSAAMPCEQLCSGTTNPAGIESVGNPELCKCINFHGLSADQFGKKIEASCSAEDAKWAAGAGKKKLYAWARKTTENVCTGQGAPCNFDAAVQTLYKRSSGDESKYIQCAFTILGWSMDPNPHQDQVFGQPARRIAHSGILEDGHRAKKSKWPKDIQTIIDGAATRFFNSDHKKSEHKLKKVMKS